MIKRWPLLSYFLLAYLFTWAIEVPMMLAARGSLNLHLPLWLEALAAFGPFLAAVVVLQQTQGAAGVRRLLASLINWRVPPVWFAFAVVSPFIVLFVALMITGETGKLLSGQVCNDLVATAKMFELIVIGGVLRGIGEEPGWRGYALPVLRSRFGPLLATFALYPFWLLWHLPSFLMRPEFQLGAWIGFSLGVLSAAIWCTLMYDKTRSVLMIAIWHALINICRGFAGAASPDSFMAFAQVVLLVALIIVVYWLFRRPPPYSDERPG